MKSSSLNRRSFFKTSSLLGLPMLMGFGKLPSSLPADDETPAPDNVLFFGDGETYKPAVYGQKLQEIAAANEVIKKRTSDSYARGGAVEDLEKEFAKITGKEKAIFMPSGTMSNQLAIRVLSGQNTKVYVQETSHVYRDEADAAQAVHSKRLIPLAKEKATFTLNDLKEAIDYHSKGEVFESGTGVISIENPVRRMNGEVFSLDEIKKISAFCKEKSYKLHLDGARIHLASSYAGVSVKEYASYFDTVYISLYKYLNSAGGAILCGEAKVIDQMPHLIKIFGGNTYQSWPYAAMAYTSLLEIDARLAKAKSAGKALIDQLNASGSFSITPIENGTNIFNFSIKVSVDFEKFSKSLADNKVFMIGPDEAGVSKFFINETVSRRDATTLKDVFLKALAAGKK